MVLPSTADPPETRVLDAAEALFYARGVQAVGMDEIRSAAGVSLKRLYGVVPSKDRLVAAVLERRDARWRARLAAHVDRVADPRARPAAVFDWLGLWFAEDGFRGCAWINLHGELGGISPEVRDLVRRHKEAFRAYLDGLVADAGLPPALGAQLFLLAEGAMVTAGITGDGAAAAGPAREAALILLNDT
jgi:AcrR family transcriptional regulator